MSQHSQLQQAEVSKLTGEPSVNHFHIAHSGVTVYAGAVALTGHVDWYKRLATALAMVAMLALPAMAHDQDHPSDHHHSDNHGNDHAKDHDHHGDDHGSHHAKDHHHGDDHGDHHAKDHHSDDDGSG